MNNGTNLDVVDFEREENLPPSALVRLGLGLLVAVGTVLFTGIGAIIEASSGGNTLVGGIVGALIGAGLATLFVLLESRHLLHEGR